MKHIFLAILLLLPPAGAAPRQRNAPAELVVCGDKPERIWTWRAKGRMDLPAEFHTLFNTTDECKPFDGGSTILITSSGGAAAVVDRLKDRVTFYGRAANAHSADLLPRGRVAVAASHDRGGKGDRLILFDIAKPNQELWTGELPWGHGVVWDARRRLLWALADEDIRVYELQDWESAAPKLHRVALIALPEAGGHDFTVVNDALIAVSTGTRCWLFDRNTRTFAPHPQLADKAKVKSISHHPANGRIAFVQAEGENWWAERIHFLNPPGVHHVAGEHFYKIRWNVAAN